MEHDTAMEMLKELEAATSLFDILYRYETFWEVILDTSKLTIIATQRNLKSFGTRSVLR